MVSALARLKCGWYRGSRSRPDAGAGFVDLERACSSRYRASWMCPPSSASRSSSGAARDTMRRYLARNARVRAALELPRRADHRQQPDGRAPRLGPHLQGPLPALPHHARRRQRYQNGFDCQGLWIEVEVEKELGFNEQARHRGVTGSTASSSCARSGSQTFAAIQTEQSHAPRLVDGLGQQLLHELRREQLHDLGLPRECHRAG